MTAPLHNPDLKGYKSAIKDAFLRAVFSLAILTGGYLAPSSYLSAEYGSLYGHGALAEAAFSFSKLVAFIYAAMAFWSLRCAFVALWWPRQK
jgi:hypothetical protein